MLRAVWIAVAALLALPASAGATGVFTIQGTTILYTGDAGADQISGFDTGSSIRFTRFGGADSAAAARAASWTPATSGSTARRRTCGPCCSTSAVATTSPRSARA